jgi:pyruvyl transferase EpsO
MADKVISMNFREKQDILKRIIQKELSPIITYDCCLLGLPYYHKNIGDFLIWQGVEIFLKELNIRCKYRATISTFRQEKVSTDDIILLNGGGDFGDVWEEPQEFRRRIVKEYPNNKIIILPQTVFYSDKEKLLYDANAFSKHSNLIICARDKISFETLKLYFSSNTILLIPDMAFYIPSSDLQKYHKKLENRVLFLKRNDKELKINNDYSKCYQDRNVDTSDWSTMNKKIFSFFILRSLFWLNRRISIFSELIDKYAFLFFKSEMIRQGVKFISKYRKVYATRLHGAILCCLLGKPFVLFNNSYGKNGNFYETWLDDIDSVEFY